MNNYSFGNYICELREKKGLSQSELGKILGVTNKAVSKWENGGAYPSSELMLPLAKALGVSIEELYIAISDGKKEKSKLRKFLDTIASYSTVITIAACTVTFICWLLFIIYADTPDKIFVIVASPIFSIILYLLGRFGLLLQSKISLMPTKFVDFGVLFFIVVSLFSGLLMIYYFISGFPNALYISLYQTTGFFCGILHFQKNRG